MSRARDLAAFVSNADGDIKFDTDTLFIDSSANRVGIGTNTPDTQLHIESTAPVLSFTDSNSFTDANDRMQVRATSDNMNFQWYDDSAATTTELMTIKSDGNVGIGTTSPEELMHLETSGVTAIKLDGTGDGAAQVSSSYGILNLEADIDDENSASYIRFNTSGNERVRINNDGEVGINTNDPTALLHIKSASATNSAQFKIESTNTGSASAPDVYLYRNSSSPADSDTLGAIWFAGNNSADESVLYASILSQALDVTDATEDGAIYFNVLDGGGAQAERLRIDGDGIKFNGDTAADNALYDYEEGTWTPVFSNSFLEGAFANATGFTGASGRYVKVGNLVTCWAEITRITGETGNLTGDDNFCITTTSLPYTPSDGTNFRHLAGEVFVYGAVGTGNNASGTLIALDGQPVIVCQITAISSAGSLDASSPIGITFSFRTTS